MRKQIMQFVAPALFAALGFGYAQAQPIECGEGYTVGRGDTLSSIALRAYGSAAAVDLLFNVNRRKIGDNPSLIRPGLDLIIPCLSGSTLTPPIEDEENASAVLEPRIPERADIAFLTGTAFPPFTDQGYPRGGMSTVIVEEAAAIGLSGKSTRVYFVNDWSAHLMTLLVDRGAFDAAFPWTQPDCSSDRLDEDSRIRCDNFYFSDPPVYENVVPFYSMKSSQFRPTSPEDLIGKRICRAAGYFTFDLVEYGLLGVGDEADKIQFIQAESPTACFRELAAGRVDYVTHNALTAQAPIAELDLSDDIAIHDAVASITTLHVIVPKNRPEARALMERINRGLRQLEASGRMAEIKREFLEIFLTATPR